MKLLRFGLLLALVSFGSPRGAEPSAEEAPTAAAPFARESAWIEEARESLAGGDFDAARAKTARAVDSLLAIPDPGRDDAWLKVVESAGTVAWRAPDIEVAETAWTSAVELRARTGKEEDPGLQSARLNLGGTLLELAARARSDDGRDRPAHQLAELEDRIAEVLSDLCRAQIRAARSALLEGSAREAEERCAEISRSLGILIAGARRVITSLWRVPDEATRDLMLDFYRRLWVERKSKGQALWEAKDERGEPRYSLRDWAAWVLTGDPR